MSSVIFIQHEKLIFVKVYSSSKKLQLDSGDILWYWGLMYCSFIGSADDWTSTMYIYAPSVKSG